MLELIKTITQPEGLTYPEITILQEEKEKLLDLAYYAAANDLHLSVRINETGEIIGASLAPPNTATFHPMYPPAAFLPLLDNACEICGDYIPDSQSICDSCY